MHLSAQLQDSPPCCLLFSWFDFCTNRPYKSLKSSVFRCVHVWSRESGSAGVRCVPAAARWGTKQLLVLTFPSTDTHPRAGVCFLSALSFMCCCFNGRSASRYHRDKLEKHLISFHVPFSSSSLQQFYFSHLRFFFCSTYFHHLLFPPSDWVCVWVFACVCACMCLSVMCVCAEPWKSWLIQP